MARMTDIMTGRGQALWLKTRDSMVWRESLVAPLWRKRVLVAALWMERVFVAALWGEIVLVVALRREIALVAALQRERVLVAALWGVFDPSVIGR